MNSTALGAVAGDVKQVYQKKLVSQLDVVRW